MRVKREKKTTCHNSKHTVQRRRTQKVHKSFERQSCHTLSRWSNVRETEVTPGPSLSIVDSREGAERGVDICVDDDDDAPEPKWGWAKDSYSLNI